MALTWVSAGPDGTLLKVRIQPRAGRTEIVGLHGGALKIRLAAPPVDGAANRALVTFLAKRLGLSKSAIDIRSGHKGRLKSLCIAELDESDIRNRLAVQD